MNANRTRWFRRTNGVVLGAMVILATLPASAQAPGGKWTEPVWKFVISTAPGLPQDVWVVGMGNNADGWMSAGVFCLGPLAQGFGPTQHATVDTDVVEAGI